MLTRQLTSAPKATSFTSTMRSEEAAPSPSLREAGCTDEAPFTRSICSGVFFMFTYHTHRKFCEIRPIKNLVTSSFSPTYSLELHIRHALRLCARPTCTCQCAKVEESPLINVVWKIIISPFFFILHPLFD